MASENQITKAMFDSEIRLYLAKSESLELIERAYQYSEEKHNHQKRNSGEPYFIHPLNVAYTLATLRVGPKTLCAGLLHDCIEDCGITINDLENDFDQEIATLVEAVSKIKNLKFDDEKEYLASNHRKIFIAMAKDIRVILIKLVDRLHNMRTLEYQEPEKRIKTATETLEVYAPIAHRLGISEIKNELEDLSFFYLERDKYDEIKHLVEKKKSERQESNNRMISEISELLQEQKIQFKIFGRSKHFYSIYRKMTQKGKRFEEILDLQAIRILTKTELSCYEILGYIHAKYTVIPGRLKDYIAMPKVNMYQSLHTTIIGEDGEVYEIQIRTEEMDAIAEQGVAAHWRYKEGRRYNAAKEQKEIEERLSWFKDMSLMTEDIDDDAKEFMGVLKRDLFEANIYVMTPKGRVIDLPNGATPIDFAYRIHTDVGHKTSGAIVNGTMVPLNTALKTGDIVQIKTNNNSVGPSEDWLKIVKSSHARNKIRSFFQKKEMERKSEYVPKGEQLLKEELAKHKLDEATYFDKEKLEKIYSNFSLTNYQDLMYALATKSLSAQAVVEKLYNKKNIFAISRIFNPAKKVKTKNSKSAIKVAGIASMKSMLANCCNPVYGDEIVGYITKGAGVKVHRNDCPNIIKEKQRLIAVYWDDLADEKQRYETRIIVYSSDRSYLLSDLVNVVSQCQAGLVEVNSKVNDDSLTAITTMTVTVENSEHLRNVLANLRKVNSVTEVARLAS